jgi:glycosyltransferase involved in cell wall biosynthesis
MPTQSKISIGMPVYNGGEFLRDALDSLLAQTETDFDLLISDNASTDDTPAIAAEYTMRDIRIRYVRQETNLGAAGNFSHVLNQATGRYFMWAAYDDLWRPTFIAESIAALESTGADFAFPTFRVKSIAYGIYKNYDRALYLPFESDDPSRRVLSFANLHHNCFKDMLLYSVFHTDILRSLNAIQDLTMGPVLCMLILSRCRATVLERTLFDKRYRKTWPGFRPKLFPKSEKIRRFEELRDQRIARAIELLPDLAGPLEIIRLHTHPYARTRRYRLMETLPAPYGHLLLK